MTQCLYGSHITGHASSTPAAALSEARSPGEVAGVMRSTIVLGKRASSSSHRCVSAHRSRSAAAPSTLRFATSPLCGRLSQDMIVNGLKPRRRRDASAASTMSKTVAPRVSGAASATRVALGALGVRRALERGADERAVALVDGHAVPELGDGQRDDLRARRGEKAHRRRGVLEAQDHVAQRRDVVHVRMAICSGVSPSRLTTG